MANHTYKLVELVGTSPEGSDAAVKNAVAYAHTQYPNLRWFEVLETRGHLEDGKVAHWQVVIKVGYTLAPPTSD